MLYGQIQIMADLRFVPDCPDQLLIDFLRIAVLYPDPPDSPDPAKLL